MKIFASLSGSARRVLGELWRRAVKFFQTWERLRPHAPDRDRAILLNLRARKAPTFAQWIHLPRTLGGRGKLAFAVFGIAFLGGAGVLILNGISYLRVFVPATGGSYIEATVGAPRYVNPVFATSEVDRDLVALTHAPLFYLDGKGTAQPGLAESYEIARDGRTITVRLRPDLRWQDEAPIVARDVVFTVSRILDPAWKSPYASNFSGVIAKDIDSRTVRFTLSEPFAPFIQNLSLAPIPEHIWKNTVSTTVRAASAQLSPVGSGPYQVEEIRRDGRAVRMLRLTRNPWFGGSSPYLDEVIIRFFSDRSAAEEAVARRGADGIGAVPAGAVGTLVRSRDTRAVRYDLPQYVALFWNLQGRELLRDSEVKRALGAAVNRERILREAFGGYGTLVSSPIPDGALGILDPGDHPTYDPVAAAEALERAGFVTAPPSTVRRKGTTDLAFTLTTLNDPSLVRSAEMIKSDLELVGARVTLDVVDAGAIRSERIEPRAYDALLIGELVGADPDPYPFWHSSQAQSSGVNLSRYQNREADMLLEDGRRTLDVARRKELYQKFMEKLRADAPALFLLRPAHVSLVSKRVKGVSGSTLADPSHRFWDVTNWYVREEKIWRWNQ